MPQKKPKDAEEEEGGAAEPAPAAADDDDDDAVLDFSKKKKKKPARARPLPRPARALPRAARPARAAVGVPCRGRGSVLCSAVFVLGSHTAVLTPTRRLSHPSPVKPDQMASPVGYYPCPRPCLTPASPPCSRAAVPTQP